MMSSYKWMENDHPGERGPLTLILKMTTAHVRFSNVSHYNNSHIQDYAHPDDLAQPNYKLFSLRNVLTICLSCSILNNKYLVTT